MTQIAKRRFAAEDDDGTLVKVEAGERLDDSHRFVKWYPDYFESDASVRSRFARAAANPRQTEDGARFEAPRTDRTADPFDRGTSDRDAGLRAIERYANELTAEAADILDELVRKPGAGVDARYLAAVGDPHYNTAFGKLLQYGSMAPARFTAKEQQAMQAVTEAEEMRAMVVGTGASGGFAVPFELDPTVMNSSNGALNPVRQIARVETMTSNEWRGVSAAGVTSKYDAEAAESNDDSPTLVQPSVKAARWDSFIPFSIELDQDWASLQRELADLMRDSKDVLDATKFLTGTGTNEPAGILNIGGTGGLTTTQRVQTAATNGYAVADGWSLKAAVPPRSINSVTYAASPQTWDATYRFVGGNSTEPLQMTSREGAFLGAPKVEWSTMATTVATGNKLIIAGDWKQFFIGDRLGLSVELVPVLFGANRRPTGQRGIYALGRTGSGVLVPNAFRYLEVR